MLGRTERALADLGVIGDYVAVDDAGVARESIARTARARQEQFRRRRRWGSGTTPRNVTRCGSEPDGWL